jgi:hypothetical protein
LKNGFSPKKQRERNEHIMPRGIRNDTSIIIEKIASRLCDRAEYEIERYCLAEGIRFDDLAAAYAGAATERFGAILHSPQQWGLRDQLQVRMETVQVHPMELPALEGSRHSRENGAALEATAQARTHPGEKVRLNKDGTPRRNYWDDMTPEQRSKEMKRRMRKWSPEAKTKWAAGGKTLKTVKSKTAKSAKGRFSPEGLERIREAAKHRWAKQKAAAKHAAKKKRTNPPDKQKVYQARYEAKKNGLPAPPLPNQEMPTVTQ